VSKIIIIYLIQIINHLRGMMYLMCKNFPGEFFNGENKRLKL